MQAIHRLKKTWELVPAQQKEVLKSLQDVVDFSQNFKSMRTRLKQLQPPCIPYLGIYLNDFLSVRIISHVNQVY